MYLDSITIEGYRSFDQPFTIEFQKGLSVLVGENGAGKSAIIDAIRLALREDEYGRTGVVDTDFHRPFIENADPSKAIRVMSVFSGLSKEEMVAFLPWTDIDSQAKLTIQVDNKETRRGRYRPTRWGGASRSSIFEWELFESINCIYLPPLRDAEAKLREGRGSRLARLLRNLDRELLETDEPHPLEEKIRQFNVSLAEDDQYAIARANKLIRQRLREALGQVFGQNTLVQFSETSFNRIVESLRLLFFPNLNAETPPGMFRSLEENSLGYNNLLYLATVLAELRSKAVDDDYLKVLLIEEPEAHLHPQLQVRLLKHLEQAAKDEKIQVIVTTHSPVLASAVSLETLIESIPFLVGISSGLS